jgi:lipopolysaccharide export system permease protein
VLANGGFWAEDRGQYLNVGRFDYDNVPEQIDIYAFAPDGSLIRAVHAKRAEILPSGIWRLTEVEETDATGTSLTTTRMDNQSWKPFLSPPQMHLLALPPDAIPPWSLIKLIHSRHIAGRAVTQYEQSLWSLVSLPFAMLGMVLIAAPFCFGAPRQANAGRPVFIGVLIGLSFELAQQLITQLGERLALPAYITALLPSLLLLIIGFSLLEQQQGTLTRRRLNQ